MSHHPDSFHSFLALLTLLIPYICVHSSSAIHHTKSILLEVASLTRRAIVLGRTIYTTLSTHFTLSKLYIVTWWAIWNTLVSIKVCAIFTFIANCLCAVFAVDRAILTLSSARIWVCIILANFQTNSILKVKSSLTVRTLVKGRTDQASCLAMLACVILLQIEASLASVDAFKLLEVVPLHTLLAVVVVKAFLTSCLAISTL